MFYTEFVIADKYSFNFCHVIFKQEAQKDSWA